MKVFTRSRVLPFLAIVLVAAGVFLARGRSRSGQPADPDRLISELIQDVHSVVPDLPPGKLPGYAVDNFKYVVAHGNETAWRLASKKAFLYRAEHLLHAKDVQVQIESAEEDPTIVNALHAKFTLDSRKLDFFGDVRVRFPDGFEMKSQVLSYDAADGRFFVPDVSPVSGSGVDHDGMSTQFSSLGLDFQRSTGKVFLKRTVEVRLVKPARAKGNRGIPEQTIVRSDEAELNRNQSEIIFHMSTKKRIEDQFVEVIEPSLNVKARRIRMRYRDFARAPNYMQAEEDVTIRELADESKYATCGQADFDRERDVILLTHFPQVYQGQDTVTGEKITMHRAADLVEVTRSNAYSAQGR